MYHNTLFGEIIKPMRQLGFRSIVAAHEADKHSKGFSAWRQLVAMVFAHLGACRSLREMEAGFNDHSLCHYHLGTKAIKRSTLSYANQHRDCAVFADTCAMLMAETAPKVRSEGRDLLYLLDSTPIPLQGWQFEGWTHDNATQRIRGLKAHIMICAQSATPTHVSITAPNVNDIEVGKQIRIEAGATYVFDRGYCDYNWWHQFTERDALFVTRLKSNAGVKVTEAHAVHERVTETILADETIAFTHKRCAGKREPNAHYATPLRRVTVARADTPNPLVIVTNDFDRPAEAIADLYRQRWGIELFFKWVKQNLKMKQFLGRTENAVKTQIYCALIAYLLIYLYRQQHGVKISMRLILARIRVSLFQRPQTEQALRRKAEWEQAEYRRRQAELWGGGGRLGQ